MGSLRNRGMRSGTRILSEPAAPFERGLLGNRVGQSSRARPVRPPLPPSRSMAGPGGSPGGAAIKARRRSSPSTCGTSPTPATRRSRNVPQLDRPVRTPRSQGLAVRAARHHANDLRVPPESVMDRSPGHRPPLILPAIWKLARDGEKAARRTTPPAGRSASVRSSRSSRSYQPNRRGAFPSSHPRVSRCRGLRSPVGSRPG